jgi:hypothetical protein
MLSKPGGEGSERARPRLIDAKPRYTLAELLARSDYSQPQPSEEREWIDAPAVGRELLRVVQGKGETHGSD